MSAEPMRHDGGPVDDPVRRIVITVVGCVLNSSDLQPEILHPKSG